MLKNERERREWYIFGFEKAIFVSQLRPFLISYIDMSYQADLFVIWKQRETSD